MIPSCGRTGTDIANSGIPVKVGMALTAHKTVVAGTVATPVSVS